MMRPDEIHAVTAGLAAKQSLSNQECEVFKGGGESELDIRQSVVCIQSRGNFSRVRAILDELFGM